ncbi:Nuclear pore complex protein Nup88 [Sarcoptes scabiei]|uniref:Nuclear pore complex protein Nup88 n=1 Tax=Sarcoptes scabiei TaxID=52283 RepID=A0A834R3N9_SARSC|nr:Nuclear pore complex protein Nup88 [Sarcoptes scabiei]
MVQQNSQALQNLIEAIKQRKYDPEVISQIFCYYEEKILIWNDKDRCLCLCTIDENYKISGVQIIELSCLPSFRINSLSLSSTGDHLALFGSNGLLVAELPRNSSFISWVAANINTNNYSDKDSHYDHSPNFESKKSENLSINSFVIAERLFLCNRNLSILCLRWHPQSKYHLLILTSDDCLRVFNIEDEYEPIKVVRLNSINDNENSFVSISSTIYSIGESSVSFDFGPPLSRYEMIVKHNQSLLATSVNEIDLIDVYPIYILQANGDVLLLYLNLKHLNHFDHVYGPLKMAPAAEDNYGSEACEILCLDSVPTLIVIGTRTGLLYHCVAIEEESDDDQYEKIDKFKTMQEKNLNLIIPETILYVIEIIELSFSLTSFQETKAKTIAENIDINTPLKLVADPKDLKRYFCIHSHGVHVVSLQFQKQLSDKVSNEFHDEKAIVEYLICTNPTVDRNPNDSIYPIGINLNHNRGFTLLSILLSNGEMISKFLSNIIIENVEEKSESDKIDLDGSITERTLKDSLEGLNRKTNFVEHINKILTKTNNLPLIKSSKSKNSIVGSFELEMLLNAIDIFKKEYIERLNLASKSIEKRKNASRNHFLEQVLSN